MANLPSMFDDVYNLAWNQSSVIKILGANSIRIMKHRVTLEGTANNTLGNTASTEVEQNYVIAVDFEDALAYQAMQTATGAFPMTWNARAFQNQPNLTGGLGSQLYTMANCYLSGDVVANDGAKSKHRFSATFKALWTGSNGGTDPYTYSAGS